ncbi:general odorant-binding protein 45-like [Toxorhynchites rutilus septentrionalis]|uniref:general odorant-binding protein 45-like n=1 Tax=Toxorhynchites rutilus septentrionalis TaxID=329112 RepID=UPI00247B04F4|nr:general odorant-binding protein 45-like [Toxorhynchites rutilus septentrionalis]
MKFILQSVSCLLVLPAFTFALTAHWLEPNTESIYTVQQECADYLRLTDEAVQQLTGFGYADTPGVRELTHCILVALNAWGDDNLPKTHVIKNFFLPAESDSCYENRTQECLDKSVKSLSPHDILGRAYHSFRCYYYHYGHIVEEEQFVPFRDFTLHQFIAESFAIENISKDELQKISDGDFFDVKKFPNIVFTYAVRAGFYDPESGPIIDRIYTQFGLPEIVSENTRNCVCAVRQQHFGEPTRTYELFKQCFANILPTPDLLRSVAQGLLESSPSEATCNVCGATTSAPHYGYGSSSVTCSVCDKSNEIIHTKLPPRYNIKY